MINFSVGTLTLCITPWERVVPLDNLSESWVKSYVEYTLPGVKIQYTIELTIDEMMILRDALQRFYDNISTQKTCSDINFSSMEKYFRLSFSQVENREIAEVNILMLPERHADSVKVADTFYLDQSYFPIIISGLTEIINWEN